MQKLDLSFYCTICYLNLMSRIFFSHTTEEVYTLSTLEKGQIFYQKNGQKNAKYLLIDWLTDTVVLNGFPSYSFSLFLSKYLGTICFSFQIIAERKIDENKQA